MASFLASRCSTCGVGRVSQHKASPVPGLRVSCVPVWRHAQQGGRRQLHVAAAGKGGVLDNPTITTPTPVKGTESSKKKPPIYKVMLHNDNYNRREYVVKILLKTVEGLTVDDAVNVMQEAHETGVAMVVACAQEQAETYVESLRVNGLISTMEPGH